MFFFHLFGVIKPEMREAILGKNVKAPQVTVTGDYRSLLQ